MEMVGIPIDVYCPNRLAKRKSKIPDSHSNYNAAGGSRRTPLAVQAFKGVSSKLAFSNMTSQISKLNPLMKLKQTTAKKNTELTGGQQHIPTIQLEGTHDLDVDRNPNQYDPNSQYHSSTNENFPSSEQLPYDTSMPPDNVNYASV
jgi:hypothetical protein